MDSTAASLIAGLDPAHLLDLGAEDSSPVAAEWEPPGLEEVARLFPTWKVQSLLGRGGMGVVYLMHQPELDRSVAVKLLPLEACREERQVERFRREARTLAKLHHPNIVALHEVGITPDGHFFFVMEYVDGLPLSQLIASGNVMVPKALEIVRQVCDALAVAHAAGVVHRDIKPSNILIDQQGQVKVADFGLARWEQPGTEGALELSQTGMFMGTAAYVAPEQARDAARADHRADLYSLGVLLYEMLTGELPRGVFQPPSRKSGSDARLDDVVQRALQERPEDRYQAAADFKKDVTSVQNFAPAVAANGSRKRWWALPIAALVILGIWMATRPPTTSVPTPPSSTVAIVPSKPLEIPPTPPPAIKPKPPKETSQPPTDPVRIASPQVPPAVIVWSAESLSPALHPPAALLKEPWTDAVLVRQGGAVLTGDGHSLAYWHESSPGKLRRMTHERPITALGQTPDAVLFVDATAQLYLLDLAQESAPVLVAGQVQNIFPSFSNTSIPGVTLEGEAMLWPLNPADKPLALKMSQPREMTLTSDRSVYALNSDGALFHLTPGMQPQEIPMPAASSLCAVGKDLFLLTLTHQVMQLGNADPLKDFKDISEIHGSDFLLLAVDASRRAAHWNPSQSDSPERFRLPADKTHLRISPVGLMAAW